MFLRNFKKIIAITAFALMSTVGWSQAASAYDYYSYYGVGYDDNYDNDWFYDYYEYDSDFYDEYDYGYYDYNYDTDMFDWEEDGLFE